MSCFRLFSDGISVTTTDGLSNLLTTIVFHALLILVMAFGAEIVVSATLSPVRSPPYIAHLSSGQYD